MCSNYKSPKLVPWPHYHPLSPLVATPTIHAETERKGEGRREEKK